MIEPDRAGMAHRGAQHVAVRLERLDLEPGGVEAGKAPVLAGGIERVGRRADAEMARDRRLLVPGVEAVGLHADRDVEIEPDLHAELVRQFGGGTELPVGGPLHEFDERDFGGLGSLCARPAHGVVRLPPFFRPFPPRLVEFVPEHLETGKARQQRARSARNVSKSCRRAGVAIAP